MRKRVNAHWPRCRLSNRIDVVSKLAALYPLTHRSPNTRTRKELVINTKDIETLRTLARRIRALADQPDMRDRPARWKRFNALDPDGPMVLCFPEGSWCEILPEDQLVCENKVARDWELRLRKQLYTSEVLKDDQPRDPVFDLNWPVERGDFGVPVQTMQGDQRGSFVYDPPLKTLPADFDKLRFREPRVDRAEMERHREWAHTIFDDILEVRVRGGFWWTVGLTCEAIKMIGLENLMLLTFDEPEDLHRLMAWLRDEQLHFMRWFEKEGLLSDQNEADYVGSGSIGYTDELPAPDRQPGTSARLKDRWGFAESQETIGISPAMFDEFIMPYQLPLLEEFGLNYYGCCEPVDERIGSILKIPRLRRVSVSPWARQDIMAEKLGRNYIYCRKPNPAPVCLVHYVLCP